MKRVLIDQERMRHPYCGLAYYCRALEQGLRELSAPDIQYAYYGSKKATATRSAGIAGTSISTPRLGALISFMSRISSSATSHIAGGCHAS